MILEAFSQRLQEKHGRGKSSAEILNDWLLHILCQPPVKHDPVTRVIHTEIGLEVSRGKMHFEGKSGSGKKLLDSLQEYCRSYDHWQFRRWLHHLRASDFIA